MIIELTLVGLIIRYFKDKNFKFINNFNLKNVYFLFIIVIAKLLVKNFFSIEFLSNNYYLIDSIFLFLLSIFFFLNGKRLYICGLGTLLNSLVIFLNKKMPVSENFAHLVMNYDKYEMIKNGKILSHGFIDNVKLKFLSDIIPIPMPYIYPRLISIGDILISIGIFIYILSSKEN